MDPRTLFGDILFTWRYDGGGKHNFCHGKAERDKPELSSLSLCEPGSTLLSGPHVLPVAAESFHLIANANLIFDQLCLENKSTYKYLNK